MIFDIFSTEPPLSKTGNIEVHCNLDLKARKYKLYPCKICILNKGFYLCSILLQDKMYILDHKKKKNSDVSISKDLLVYPIL